MEKNTNGSFINIAIDNKNKAKMNIDVNATYGEIIDMMAYFIIATSERSDADCANTLKDLATKCIKYAPDKFKKFLVSEPNIN